LTPIFECPPSSYRTSEETREVGECGVTAAASTSVYAVKVEIFYCPV
jgi:hypothetical protein